jgi:DNA polymerase-3 subunit beta
VATVAPIAGVGKETIDALIPRKALAEMATLVKGAAEDVQTGAEDNHIYFEAGSRLLISRRLSGQFPNYEMVIFDRKELERLVRLVATMSDDRSRSIRLQFETGSLKLRSQTVEFGEGQ